MAIKNEVNCFALAASRLHKTVFPKYPEIKKKIQHESYTYYNKNMDLRTFVHGDDFVTCGGRADCQWFHRALKGRFSIKTKVVGLGEGEVREERILNRIIRVTEDGWELEADQRHADIIVKQLQMEDYQQRMCTLFYNLH